MKRILALVYVPLIAIYLLMSVIYPLDSDTIARRHFSHGHAQFLALVVAVVFITVWLVAFYAAWQLKAYAKNIRKHPDGKAFMDMATGLQVLALYLPLRSVTKILLDYLAHLHPSWITPTDLVITYFNIILPIIAFIYISRGAVKLFDLAKVRFTLADRYGIILVFSAIGASFCYITHHAHGLNTTNWLLVTDYNAVGPVLRAATIIIPYLFMWFIGLLAAYEIYLYHRTVKGIFYRQSLSLLAIGLSFVIIASIAIQFLTAISNGLKSIPIGLVLAITFGVLLLIVVSFVMVIRGVQKLRRLEEV